MMLIIGAGLAAVRAIESMRATGYDGPITLVGDEAHLPYERPPLSKEALRIELADSDLSIQPSTFYADHRVALVLGRAAVRLDEHQRSVELSDGTSLSYSRLLIATGSAPATLEVPGSGLENVLTLRTLGDAARLRERLRNAERVVVIGAGLIGLEVAAVARELGRDVVVVERAARPLARLLGGHEVADAVRALHESRGVDLRTNATVAKYEGSTAVERVLLADGRALESDLVVVAVGIRPRTEWLAGSGVAVGDGVLVGSHGETSVAGVFAAGDVARVVLRPGESARLESYGHAHSQGVAVGRTLAGVPSAYTSLPAASSEQFGTRLQLSLIHI